MTLIKYPAMQPKYLKNVCFNILIFIFFDRFAQKYFIIIIIIIFFIFKYPKCQNLNNLKVYSNHRYLILGLVVFVKVMIWFNFETSIDSISQINFRNLLTNVFYV